MGAQHMLKFPRPARTRASGALRTLLGRLYAPRLPHPPPARSDADEAGPQDCDRLAGGRVEPV